MASIDGQKVVESSDVLLQDLGGEAVLLNLAMGRYYGLDEASFHMYKTLTSSMSVQEAYDSLLAEYDIDPEKLKSDLEIFLSQLMENGLVVYVDS